MGNFTLKQLSHFLWGKKHLWDKENILQSSESEYL